MFGLRKKKSKEKTINAAHVEGLPITNNENLTLKLDEEGLELITNSQEFFIDMSKISLIDYKNEVEMQQIIKQSAPGMVIGAATFGLLGAMVGGRVKTKEKRKVLHFVIINYDDKTVILQTDDFYGAGQLVDYYRSLNPKSKPLRVEL